MNTSLYLFPLPVLQTLSVPKTIENGLQALGFVGEPWCAGHFFVGADFFDFVGFTGCSPHLPLQPPTPENPVFCHVSYRWNMAQPPVLTTPRRSRPRCPNCRTRVEDSTTHLQVWRLNARQLYRCPACSEQYPVAELDWRHYGLGACNWIQIHHVYPGEALPTDALLAHLHAVSGRTWHYAWAESA